MESNKSIGGTDQAAGSHDPVRATDVSEPTKVRKSWRRRAVALALAALVFGTIWLLEVVPRKEARANLNKETIDLSVSAVSVLKPKTGSQARQIVLRLDRNPGRRRFRRVDDPSRYGTCRRAGEQHDPKTP